MTLHDHLGAFFAGHAIERDVWTDGPIEQRAPGFCVWVVAPGPRSSTWSYVTDGCWAATRLENGHGLEFVLAANAHDRRYVEIATILAYYHCGPPEQRLDHGHTTWLGEPWVKRSPLTHMLISLPYPYGPELEIYEHSGGHTRILWALPITEDEKSFRHEHGLEALESRFDEHGIDYANPRRRSVL